MRAYNILSRLGFRWEALVVPAAFAVGSGLCEGAMLAVLIPTVEVVFGVDGSPTALSGFVGRPIRALIEGRSAASAVAILISLLTASIVARVFFDYAGSLKMARNVQNFLASTRDRIWAGYLSSGRSFFDKVGPSHANAVLLNHTFHLASGLSTMRSTLVTATMACAYGAAIVGISWKLTLVSVLMFPLYKWLGNRVQRSVEFRAKAIHALSRRYDGHVGDSLRNLTLIQTGNLQEREQARHSETVRAMASMELGMEKRSLLLQGAQELVIPVFVFLLAVLASHSDIMESELQGAHVLVFIFALRRLSSQLSVLKQLMISLQKLSPYANSLAETLDACARHVTPSGQVSCPKLVDRIRVRDLTFEMDSGSRIIDGASFDIPANKRTAIVGASGAGKSTVLNLLMRLYEAPSGSIFFDEIDLSQIDTASLRERIGFVSQDSYVLTATLRANLLLFARDGQGDAEFVAALSRACFPLDSPSFADGLDTLLGEGGIQLSGGERQRLSLARVLLRSPDILVLDEPTSALDPLTEAQLMDTLKSDNLPRTTILVTHNLSAVAGYDHVIVMSLGRVEAQGTPDELRAQNGSFARGLAQQSTELAAAGGSRVG